MSRNVSVFCVDPGVTTGWAWACLGRKELAGGDVVGAIHSARRHRSGAQGGDTRFLYGQVETYRGDENQHVQELISLMLMTHNMARRTTGGIVSTHTNLVIESFTLRLKTKDRSLLAPVRLTAALGYAVHVHPDLSPRLHMQSPSDAMSTVTDDRLRQWDLWIKGQQHARDAVRHLILWLRKEFG